MLAYLLVCTALAAANAQPLTPWAPGFERPFESTINFDTVEMLRKALDLSDDQVAAVHSMVQAHSQRFDEFVNMQRPVKEGLDAQLESQRTATPGYLKVLLEREQVLAQVADQQAALDKATLEQIKQVLSEQQVERWPLFMIQYDGERWASPVWMYAEECPRITDILKSLQEANEGEPSLLDDQNIEPLIVEYSARLDQHLTDLAEISIESARSFDRSKRWGDDGTNVWQEGSSPGEKTPHDKWVERLAATHRKIKAVNRDYAAMIGAALAEQFQSSFRREYSAATLRCVGIPPTTLTAELYIQQALALSTLTAEQERDIRSLLAAYHAEASAANTTLLRAQEREVETRMGLNEQNRESVKAALTKSTEDRLALEARFITNVWNLLDESQQASIPKPKEQTHIAPRPRNEK